MYCKFCLLPAFRASLQFLAKRDLVEVCWFSPQDNVSIPILSITERHSLSLHSSIRTSFGIPHGLLSPCIGEKYGLTKFRINNLTDNLGSSYSPEEQRSRVPKPPWYNLSSYLLVTAFQQIWLLKHNDVYHSFTSVNHITPALLLSASLLADSVQSHDQSSTAIFVPGALHPGITSDAHPGRLLIVKNQVKSAS